MAVGAKMVVLCLFIYIKVCVAGLGAIKHTLTDTSVCEFFFMRVVQEEVFLL